MIGQKGMPAIHGGVERHVHELSVRLVQAGHTVDAYARKWYTGDVPDAIDGVQIVHTPTLHTKHLDTIIHTITATVAAMRSDAEILHYHGVGPSLLSFLPRIFTPSKKVVTTFHSIDRKHAKWGMIAKLALTIGEWAACRFAHTTIAVSRTIQQYARDVYDAEVTYIPNGVPLMQKKKTSDTLAQFGIASGEYILALSRLIPHKGMHYLVSAYLQMEAEDPKALQGKKLVIVGDGYYTEEYVQYLKQMALGSKNIIFTGFQSGTTLDELMSHAHLYVHPSNNEGLPITVLEAMSYGLPTLVSDIPEHRELIPDGAYHFVAGDVGSLIKSLTHMLADTQARATSAKTNRETIKQSFTWNIVVQDIIHLYDTTLHASDTLSVTTIPVIQ